MWCSKNNMKAMFFSGAALVLIGLGMILMDWTLAGVLVMCIGVALGVIGFMGLRMNLLVEMKTRKNKKTPGE